MTQPLAIVIPAYKDTYLRKSLESIASQSNKEFTLYIGDDASPYDLKKIADEFKNEIDLVYHRFQSNLGGEDLVAQWERCIDLTNNEPYIWLFSDDDVMEPGCVEAFYKLPQEIRDNYLLHYDVKIIDDLQNGIILDAQRYQQKMSALDFINDKINNKIISFVVEYVFSRKLYKKARGFQKFDLAWGSDITTWFKMASLCNGIYTIQAENSFVRWRKSSQNITPNMSHDITLRKMHALIENAAFVQDMLVKLGQSRNFKIHAKSIWGAIMRHGTFLSYGDILNLYFSYIKKVGFPLQSTISFGVVILKKFIGVRYYA